MHFKEGLSEREREILGLIAGGAADKEIAHQLHLSLNTVKWHNRQIYAKLGVSSRTQAVAAAERLDLLGEDVVPEKPSSRIPNNLPAPVSSFVGREKEIEEIKTLLESHRLVTLTGPGGVGKTRLALETAQSLMDTGRFPDGIYFVELAPVSKPERVGDVITESFGSISSAGMPAEVFLKSFLEDRELLLLIDNFEHLLEAAQ
ncbi:MAG: LuxR C-terminal-related transcriptional regulator, partial [Anaerolineales bacterium]